MFTSHCGDLKSVSSAVCCMGLLNLSLSLRDLDLVLGFLGLDRSGGQGCNDVVFTCNSWLYLMALIFIILKLNLRNLCSVP